MVGDSMGYCLSCGKLDDLDGGLCKKCQREFAIAGKNLHEPKLPEQITHYWILNNARRYNTTISRAFIRAVRYEQVGKSKSDGGLL